MRIEYCELIPHIFEHEVILVPMNINNSFNTGFRYDINLNFPGIKDEETPNKYGSKEKIGTIFEIKKYNLIFIMCYMLKANIKNGVDSVDYNALEKCLNEVIKKYSNKNIALPLLGTDNGGNKDVILELIQKKLSQLDNVTLYYYEQKNTSHETFKEIAALHKELKDKSITTDEFIKRRSAIEWRRRNGIFKPMPEDYKYIPRRGEKK